MSLITHTLLIFHIASGFIALSTGFLSMLNRKGGKTHRLTGKVFFGGMTGVFLTATLISILRPNPFLFMVGFFSYYLACAGYRALYLKRLHLKQKPVWVDWLIISSGVLFGVGLIIFCFNWFQFRGAWGFVPFSLGVFCLTTAIGDFQSFYQSPKHKQYRLISHGSKMGGAFAATVTAFIVVNFQSELIHGCFGFYRVLL